MKSMDFYFKINLLQVPVTNFRSAKQPKVSQSIMCLNDQVRIIRTSFENNSCFLPLVIINFNYLHIMFSLNQISLASIWGGPQITGQCFLLKKPTKDRTGRQEFLGIS